MLSALTAAAVAAAPLTTHWNGPGGFGWLWLLVPLFWITVFVLLFAFLGRRWRRGGGPWQMHGSPEQTLGDRYAKGEIDEQEYRARLEVLRANRSGR
ncbi:SHOCT domain-containing protein [Lysobacter korlensis]|uniref:SHOCT domain-containing protein n=1 Tax=Lysobacter korlensis TaxID=553636 RepID=A0ABV6RXV1_9GAMM